MIGELFAALEESGANAGAEELAEILWLAARIDGGSGRPPAHQQDTTPGPNTPPLHDPQSPPSASTAGAAGLEERFYSAADMADAATGAVRAVDLVRVRRAASLRDRLEVMRALRPLRRAALGHGSLAQSELDEELTVRSSIEHCLPIPVFRPRRGRWLSLALVIDAHHSMLLWHDLVAELRRVFVQTGIFRDVRTWHLSGTGPRETPRVARTGGEPRSVHEVTDPSGHQLILVVTDTVAGGWSSSSIHAVLRHWAAHNPVALLNVLPRRLWDRGAVRPRSLPVRAPKPAAPNASWRLELAAGGRRRRRRHAPAPGIAVPVVEASPDSISALARLVGGSGLWSRLPCLALPRTPDTTREPLSTAPGPPEEPATVDDSLRRFRADASPLAQALAGYLSAVPLSLPVMNLVRQVMLPASDHGHLAEVALGGLFEPWEHELRTVRTDLERMPFRFRAGVREALLGSQRRDEVTAVQELVRRETGTFVTARSPGPAGDFLAARGTPGGTGGRTMDQDALPFADRRSTPSPVGLPVRDLLPPGEGYHLSAHEGVDALLDDAIDRAAAGTSQLVVLVGERGSGKTSAALRSLHRIPAHWRVWSPSRTVTVMHDAPKVGPRTVVVLDDLDTSADRAVFTAGGFAHTVRELFENSERAPVLILATMTPETWRGLGATATEGSAGGDEGWPRLLDRAHVISLPPVGAWPAMPTGEPSDARVVMIADISDPVRGGRLIRHLGTGLLLAPQVILTAARNMTRHAVQGGIKAGNRRGALTVKGWTDCSVVWKHDTLDAALLLAGEALVAPETDGFFSVPQWARLTDGTSLESCHIAGLTVQGVNPRLSGRVPGTLRASSSPRPGAPYTFEAAIPVPPSLDVPLSGAPVLHDGFLLGFSLTADHARRGRLPVVGLNTLLDDEGFTNACRRHLWRAPRLASLPIAETRRGGENRAESQYALGIAVHLRTTARPRRTGAEALRHVRTLVTDILGPDETRTEAPVGKGSRVDLLAVKRLDRTALAQLPDRLLELESALTLPDGSQDHRSDRAAESLSGRAVDIAATLVPWNVKTDFPGTRATAEAGGILTADAVRQRLRRSSDPVNVVLSNTLHERLNSWFAPGDREQFEEVLFTSTGPTVKVWVRLGTHRTPAEVATLIRGVEDLRAFEREMRTRVTAYAEGLQGQLEMLDESGTEGTLRTELDGFKHEAETRLMAYLESQSRVLLEHGLPAELPPLDSKGEDLRRFHQEYGDRLLDQIQALRRRVEHRQDTPLLDLTPFAAPPDEPYPTPLHRSLAELKEFVAQLKNLTVKSPRQEPTPSKSPQGRL
ncbi:SAV_2336 N-terminal domain-related protein [Streptomyces sp. NPDC051014]|uniref:SAV_2336 N-terminal domain-related protein n=1 Tax=Streptomyces sp. NPDC051014 TaxID=3155751 RepID=UPI0033F4030B